MHHNMKALSFFFLILLGLSSSDDVELCPDESDISPCECSENDDSGSLEVECLEDQTLADLKKALSGLSGKKNIDLVIASADLGTVPSDFFSGLEINSLDINRCALDSLSDDGPVLSGLEDTLEELIILSSFTEENVPVKLKLGHLRALKEVDLSFNVITEIDDEWFNSGPTSLEFLTVSNNGIQKLGNNAFANLTNLKQLALDGNRFGDIHRSMLPSPASSLDTLELDNNAFTAIPEDLFSEMPLLTLVTLRKNGLLRVDFRTWNPVWSQLQAVSLEENPIECDSTMDWIIRGKTSPAIYGKCYAPRHIEGMDISDYLDSKING